MTCQTITIARRDLGRELDRIRRTGGVVAHCVPAGDLCELTYWSITPVQQPFRPAGG